MLRNRSIIRGPLFAAVVVVGMVIAQGHANASSGDPFGGAAPKFDILAGRDAVDVGDAWFLRVTEAGNEELRVHFHVPDGFTESHLCLSDAAFDGRTPPGQCPYKTSTPGTEESYDIDLGTAYLGGPLFIQLHVAGDDWSAYPGHVDPDRGSFYGNLEIDGDEVVGTDDSQDTETTDGTDDVIDDETDVVNDDETDGGDVDEGVNDEGDGDVVDDTGTTDGTNDETDSDDPVQGDDENTDDGEVVVDNPGAGDVDPLEGRDDDGSEVVDGTTDETEQDSTDTPDDDPTIVVVPGDTAAGSDDDVDAALTSSTNVDRPAVEVLGAVLRPSARTSLPRTGAEIPQLVVMAFGLLLGGAALVRTARRHSVVS